MKELAATSAKVADWTKYGARFRDNFVSLAQLLNELVARSLLQELAATSANVADWKTKIRRKVS